MNRILLAVSLLFFSLNCYSSPAESLARMQGDSNYVDLSNIPGVAIDLRYASTNNFTGTNLYGLFNRAFLQATAAQKLKMAAENLQKIKPGYKLMVLDAARPRSVQQKLWEKVRGTDMQRYVANPTKGSIHNYGYAIDLTIVDVNSKELDMGTAFDTFNPLSQPALEAKFLKEGKLTNVQIENRILLRKIMQDAGFTQLPIEWWHYEAKPADVEQRQYQIIE